MKYLLTALAFLLLAGCDSGAQIASRNLSKAADNFEIERRIVFYNVITGAYILVVEGRCAVGAGDSARSITVTCRVNKSEYKKHLMGLSDNVTYFVEQLETAKVNEYHYRVVFKPQQILPNVDFQGSTEALKDLAQ